jgi:hypothetical protein
VALTVLVLFHFGGIVTAVTHPNPTPWLTEQVWGRVYRPYLQFCYLNNAYHFYSPEPGPASQLWFEISYSDGGHRWVKVPRRPQDVADPLSVEYYRLLSITEATNLPTPPLMLGPGEFKAAARRRQQAGIPFDPETPDAAQYQQPIDHVRKFILPSYARYAARVYAKEGAEVTGVRIYRVTHIILLPTHFADGISPYDPTTYRPYYQGKFDKDGNLLDPLDPMLYWLVPILQQPKPTVTVMPNRGLKAGEYDVKDYVKVHAGSDHEEGN